MTNAQIIFNESMELMKQGIIKGTGRTFTFTDDAGNTHTIEEPEPIHTFAKWRELGFSVKKGEHAKATFYIWKAGKGKAKEEDANADGENTELKMFMKKAFFFTFDQVEKIKEREVKTA